MINHFPLWGDIPQWVCEMPPAPPAPLAPTPVPVPPTACPPCTEGKNSVLNPSPRPPKGPMRVIEKPVLPPCDHEDDVSLPDRIFNPIRSNPFRIEPGYSILLTAVGFKEEAYKEDGTVFSGPQVACVRRILLGHECKPLPDQIPCGWIFDPKMVHATIASDEVVISNCQPWQLTPCNNIGIISLPGLYQLEFNDATMIGVAQVYAERFENRHLPQNLQGLYFM